MDDMFQLRQDMNQKEFQLFTQNRLQMEAEENMQMTAEKLQENYEEKQKATVSAPVELDMPPQDADEKESTRKRRERRILESQGKTLRKNRSQEREQWFQEKRKEIKRTGKLNRDDDEFFAIKLHEEHFSPRYVLENFAEVRQELDNLKAKIDFYNQLRRDQQVVPWEYVFRLGEIERMYENAEGAVNSALAAMGFRYEREKSGKFRFTKNQDPERIEIGKKNNLEYRRSIKETAENTDEKVADKLIELSQQSLKRSYRQMREDMKNDPNNSFIPSEHLTNSRQFEAIKEMRDLMAEHPDEYHANKEVLDKMYQEVFRLMEINGTLYEQNAAIKNANDDEMMAASKKMQEIIIRRQEVFLKKTGLIQNRANYVIEGMKYLLNTIEKDDLSKRAERMIREFREQPEFIQERNAMGVKAGAYAHMLKERETIFKDLEKQGYYYYTTDRVTDEDWSFLLFLEPGQKVHNEQVVGMFRGINKAKQKYWDNRWSKAQCDARIGEIVKPIFTKYLDKMEAFDTKELESCSDEELLARTEELQEMSIQGEKIMDAAKYTDPADPQGRSILDARFGDESSRMLFELKCSIVQSYALRARSLARIRAYEKDILTKDCFTTNEINQLVGDHVREYYADEEYTKELMLTFAKRELERSEAMKDAAYNRYFHSEEIHRKYITSGALVFPELREGHPGYQQKLNEAKQEGMNALGLEQSMNDTHIETYYKQVQDRIADISQKLKNKDIDAKQSNALKEERDSLTERCEYLRDIYGLSLKHYKLSDGSPEDLIPEAIFRSYGSIESQPSFHEMSEEEFRTMCRQLSAGALERETATEEERESYRAENVRGLLTYKAHMSEHYEMLEDMLHHKLPSLVYLEEHRDELLRYFANVQVDMHLVEKSRDMIDMTKPADERLFHLVNVYNSMALYMAGVTSLMPDQTMDCREAEANSRAVVRKEKRSFDYLDANPRQ